MIVGVVKRWPRDGAIRAIWCNKVALKSDAESYSFFAYYPHSLHV